MAFNIQLPRHCLAGLMMNGRIGNSSTAPLSAADWKISIRLRGAFRVLDRDGREFEIISKRGRAILILLCLADGFKAERKKLMGLLWDAKPERDAANSFRQELSRLRKALEPLGDQLLPRFNNDEIGLDPALVSIDIREEFRAIADTAAPLAASVVDRTPLLTCGVGTTEAFDEEIERARVANQADKEAALHQRAARLTKASLPAKYVIGELHQLASFEPGCQEWCQLLLQALALNGSEAEVERTLERCRRATAVAGEELLQETLRVAEAARRSIRARDRSGQPILLQADTVSATPSTTPALPKLLPCDPTCIGIRPLSNHTGEASIDGLTELLNINLLTDLDLIAKPFTVVEIGPARRDPSSLELRCDYVIVPDLHLVRIGCEQQLAMVYNIKSTDPIAGRRSNRAMQILELVRNDARLLSQRAVAKMHMDLFVLESARISRLAIGERSPIEHLTHGLQLLRTSNRPDSMQQALASLVAALQAMPDNPDAFAGIGHIYHRCATQPGFVANREAAILAGQSAVKAALAADPEHIHGNYVMAMLTSTQGQPERAEIVFDRLLESTAHTYGTGYRGYNRVMIDQPQRGLADIRDTVGRLPDDGTQAIFRGFCGFAEFHCDNLVDARAAFRHALSIEPRNGMAQVWLAGTSQLSGDRFEARQALDAFRAANPDYDIAQFKLNWGSARSRNHAYMARTTRMVEALSELGLPRAS